MSPEALSAGSAVFTSIANALGLTTEDVTEILDHLGDDPVGRPHDGMTALEDAFAQGKDGESKMDRAVDAVQNADNMGSDEKEKCGKAVAEARDAIENGKPDPTLRKTTVGELGLNDKVIIMSDGPGPDGESYVAKRFDVELPPDTVVYEKTFTYTDAEGIERTEKLYFFEQCGNPAVDAADDDLVSPAPVVPPTDTCEPSWRSDTGYSKGGIDHDGNPNTPPLHEVPMRFASRMSLADALAGLKESEEFANLKVGESRFVLLMVDEDCDRHPELARCVTVTRTAEGPEGLEICEGPLDTKRGPGERLYDAMEKEDQVKWLAK